MGPSVNTPADIVYEIGSTGNNFTWSPYDVNPNSYVVYLDGAILYSGLWNNTAEEIFINVDVFAVGVYNFTLYLEDATGKSQIDTIFISVTEIVISEYGMLLPVILCPLFALVLVLIKKRIN